jgi:6-phosphogluconolactonase
MSGQLVVVHPDADLLAQATAARLLTRLLDLQSVQESRHVVLTGGTVGIRTLQRVAQSPLIDAVDWSGVHLWWGDERFLPDGDADRNETQARDALIDELVASGALPSGNVHPMPALGRDVTTPEESAAAYADELARHAGPGGAGVTAAAPIFDVLLLGMGPDGHVASLFPGHAALDVVGTSTVGVHGSPKPPPERVSLTFDTIRAAHEVWIVAAGSEKATAVASALTDVDPHVTPAAGAVGSRATLWLVDAAAAAQSSFSRPDVP